MQFHQETVMWVSLSSIACFLSCVSPTSWPQKDEINIAAVPMKMASLLKRNTKYKLDAISEKTKQLRTSNSDDIGTVLSQLTGLNKVGPFHKIKGKHARVPNGNERTRLQRQRRSASSSGNAKRAKVCHGGKIYVNLTNYSNIVAPIGFETQYCGKWYPMPISNDPVTKSVSQAILDSFNKMKIFSKLVFGNSKCCAPTKTKDLVVLYNDPVQHYSMIKYVQKVIVRSCGCHVV